MDIDPSNVVVQLCARGIEAEMAGRAEEALSLYVQAWDKRTDGYEACIAAHYVARLQKDLEDVLHWNQESLLAADSVVDGRVAAFYPSLYLNMGKAHEDLGHRDEAQRFYRLAANGLAALPQGQHTDIVRQGITAGLARVAGGSMSSY